METKSRTIFYSTPPSPQISAQTYRIGTRKDYLISLVKLGLSSTLFSITRLDKFRNQWVRMGGILLTNILNHWRKFQCLSTWTGPSDLMVRVTKGGMLLESNVVLFHLTESPLAIQTSPEPKGRDGGYVLSREVGLITMGSRVVLSRLQRFYP